MAPPATYLKQVGDARPAEGGVPSAGPIYKSVMPDLEITANTPTTLYEVFELAVKDFAERPCLGTRKKQEDGTVGPFEFQTYTQVHEQVVQVASALKEIGVAGGNRVGIYGVNCPEWMIAMQVRSTFLRRMWM